MQASLPPVAADDEEDDAVAAAANEASLRPVAGDEEEDDVVVAASQAAIAAIAAAALAETEAGLNGEEEEEMRYCACDLEIVGLFSSTNGRSCSAHQCCGKEVKKGDILRLVKTVVTVNMAPEEAIKLVRIIDGVDGCTVAFVPRVWTNLNMVKRNINKFVVVQELYEHSSNVSKRMKSKRNLGVAGCIYLDEIPRDE